MEKINFKKVLSGKFFKIVISFFVLTFFAGAVFVKFKNEKAIVEVQDIAEVSKFETSETDSEDNTGVLAEAISITPTSKPQVKLSPTPTSITKLKNNSSTTQNNQTANVQGGR